MMQLPHRFIWGQLTRHKSFFGVQLGVQRCLETTATLPPTAASQPPHVPPKKPTKEVKEVHFPVPWGHISGKWWGYQADVRPVLMLHGWQDNAASFDALAPLLAVGPLLALDAVGHGRSSHYPLGQCYTFVDSVVALRLVVKQLGFEKVSLIGHSMGGATAYSYAAGKWWGSTDVRPLLALHGWQDNAGTWDRLAPLLPPDVSLLAMDFPGHGRSSHFHPGRCYHFIEYVSFVRRVAKHYGWDKVSLIGHSLGSITAFVYACVYPETVDRYVGVDAMKPYSYNPVKGVRSSGQAIDAFLATARLDPAAAPSYTYADARTRLVEASGGSLTGQTADHLLARGLAKMADGRYRFTRDPRLKVAQLTNWTHATILELASNVACEVCLVNARPGLAYDKTERHQEVYDTVRKSAKRFELHEVEGGHHVHLSHPEVLLPIVMDFVKRR